MYATVQDVFNEAFEALDIELVTPTEWGDHRRHHAC
jgi:acid stress-induced BolA-like protein IbaG/YrbA